MIMDFSSHEHPSHLVPERTTAWKAIAAEQLRLLPNETAYASQQIIVAITIGQPFQLDWQVEGERKQFGQWMNPGDCHIVPANLTFHSNCFGNSRLFLMALEPTLLERAAQDIGGQDSTKLRHHLGSSDTVLKHFGQLIQIELDSGGLGGQLYVESLAQALAVHLLRHYSMEQRSNHPQGASQHKLRQVNDYINEFLDQNLTLANLAQVAQLSPTYFATLFKQSTGVSPHQFVIQRRIEQAKKLLRQGELTLSEIALQVGEAHQSHLNYHFKRIVGVTPKAILQKSS